MSKAFIIGVIVCWIVLIFEYKRTKTNLDSINDIIHRAESVLFDYGFRHFKKLNEINRLINDVGSIEEYRRLSTLYIITPTFERPTQYAELTRLQNTLRLIPKVFWIVIEDSEYKSKDVFVLLKQSKLPFLHLNIYFNSTKYVIKRSKHNPALFNIHRGSRQRNLALDWLKTNMNNIDSNGVIYFADDDNSYKLKLFQEMRHTNKISIWPVAFLGKGMYERPIAKTNCNPNLLDQVIGFFYIDGLSNKKRVFPTDMASFAINLKHLASRPTSLFPDITRNNSYESTFLEQMGKVRDLQAKANCGRELNVWHIRTECKENMKRNIGEDYIVETNYGMKLNNNETQSYHDMQRVNSQPIIFVFGSGGSGTTLMRAILDSSPRINCGYETRIIPKMLTFLHNFKLQYDHLKVVNNSNIDSATALFLVKLLERNQELMPSVDILCAKDPAVMDHIKYLHGILPQAKFVYMVRDGRASSLSNMDRLHLPMTTEVFYDYLYNWNKNNTQTFNECKRMGPLYCKMIKYEDLVTKSKEIIIDLLQFLQIPFTPNFLQHNKANDSVKFNNETAQGIYTKALNTWRGKIEYNKTLVKLEYPMIEKFGYTIDFNDEIDGTNIF